MKQLLSYASHSAGSSPKTEITEEFSALETGQQLTVNTESRVIEVTDARHSGMFSFIQRGTAQVRPGLPTFGGLYTQ